MLDNLFTYLNNHSQEEINTATKFVLALTLFLCAVAAY